MEKEALVKSLKEQGLLQTPRIIRVFLKTERADFLPPELRESAYEDTPLPIGEGQTISAPHMVAVMTEALQVRVNDKILEIGTGSGYQAAIFAQLASKGVVFTVENVEELARAAGKKLARYKNVHVVVGDGSLGLPEQAPFNKIVATCACPATPKPWIEQLAEGGRIIAPVGGPYEQDLILIEKFNNKTRTQSLGFPCAFVQMRGEYGFQSL